MPQTTLLLYHFDTSSFIEYSTDLQPLNEIPFSIPPDCSLYNTFPAPVGNFLLIELDCPRGQTVLFFDTATGATTQPITDTDAHFLAWASDGIHAYLKIDSFINPRVIRISATGKFAVLAIHAYTYDLAVNPATDDFVFTFSRGLGFGSEIHFTQYTVRNPALSAVEETKILYADPFNYISFARFSPDGKQIAFIKIPDTQTPFTVGELWVMNADGSNPRKLAEADAGHGFAANWSPDGTRIAFVQRANPADETADHSAAALISHLYSINVADGTLTQITHFENGYVETPHWSPDGNRLIFNGVVDGRMNVFSAAGVSGEIQILETESACCPAWMRK